MVSVTSLLTVLAAVSAPLVATAHSVIDTHAVAAAGASEAATINPLVDDSLATSSVLASDEDVYAYGGGLELVSTVLETDVEEHGRSLLRSKRRRGTSRASPKFKKKKSKKKSKRGGKKKKGGKKKGGKKGKGSKKKSFQNKKFGGSKRSSGKTLGIAKKAHGTFFSGMGSPTGGCGVPPGKAYDDNGKQLPFVALNTNSEFAYGSNCGRWVEITLEENCVGAGNSAYSPCNGGKFVRDGMSGQKINGYVMDSCADSNFWCQDDTYHLDISKPYLTAKGYIGGSRGSKNWNGRKISWKYMSGVPQGWTMRDPKFMWKQGSKWIKNGKGFYAAIVAYNTPNGIGAVQQKSCGKWNNVRPLNHLGNMWVLDKPCDAEYRKPNGGAGQKICVRVMDVNGSLYGEYCLVWECGGTGSCPSEVDALTYKQ